VPHQAGGAALAATPRGEVEVGKAIAAEGARAVHR